MWKTLYDSPLWLPILPTCVAIGVLVATALGVFGRSRLVRGYVLVAALVAAADAWLGGPWSPLPATGALSTASVVLFVIAGDLRYFLASRLGAVPLRRALLCATALAFVVPVASQLGVRVPFPHAPERVLFLAYEVGLLALVVVELRRTTRDAASRALFWFELLQYALWIAADVVLLAQLEVGHALRIVPNVLYYCAFVPYAGWALRQRFCANAQPGSLSSVRCDSPSRVPQVL